MKPRRKFPTKNPLTVLQRPPPFPWGGLKAEGLKPGKKNSKGPLKTKAKKNLWGLTQR